MSFRVNVSAILAYQRCPTDWYYRYVLRRVPRETEHYYESGNFWHALMGLAAHSGLGAAIEAAPTLMTEILDLAATDPDTSDDNFKKLKDEVERLFLLLPHTPSAFYSTKTLAIEKTLEAVIPPFERGVSLFGRPDRISNSHNSVWHDQHKSVSDRTAIAPYVAATERSLHELGYAYLICGAYGYPLSQYGGTNLHIVRKLSRKGCIERPAEAFVSEFIPIRESQVLDALEDIQQIALDMQECLAGTRRITQNRTADLNRYGSKLSPYWEARSGRVSINDDRYYRTLPPDDYETVGTETAVEE